MSRSYKHRKGTLVHVKEQNSRFGKQQASAAVRRAVDVPDGRQYKNIIVRGISVIMHGRKTNIHGMNSGVTGLIPLTAFQTDMDLMILNTTEASFVTGRKPIDSMSSIIKQSNHVPHLLCKELLL